MRRSLPLTIVSVAAFAIVPAAASGGKEQVHYTITLHDAAPATKVDGFTVRQRGTGAATGENVQGSQDIVITGSRIPQPNLLTGGINRLIIVTQFKSGNCTVGKRYRGATVAGGGKRQLLTDVTIAGCARSGPEERITFVYGNMRNSR